MNSLNTQTFTQTITKVIDKSKKVIYLILKKKPLHEEIYENLQCEAEERFKKFVEKKKPLLQQIQPENPEVFFECFLIKAMINILKQMLEEKKIKLTEKDLNLFDNVFENDKLNNENPKKNDCENKKEEDNLNQKV